MPLTSHISRRSFLSSAYGLTAAKLVPSAGSQKNNVPPPQALPSELSQAEQNDVNRSRMAQDLKNYFHEGYSCAESILLVCLRYLDKPEDLVWAAGGFGGGMGQKDVCGFLTGGILGPGLAAGALDRERSESKALCSQAVRAYWTWWEQQAPVRCAAIRPAGSASEICSRLGQLAAARLEQQIRAFSD